MKPIALYLYLGASMKCPDCMAVVAQLGEDGQISLTEARQKLLEHKEVFHLEAPRTDKLLRIWAKIEAKHTAEHHTDWNAFE